MSNRVGVYIARSADGGATWPVQHQVPFQEVNPILTDQFGGSIAIDSLGGVNVIWWEAEPFTVLGAVHHTYTLYYARYQDFAFANGSPPHAVRQLYQWDSRDYLDDLGDYQWIVAVDQKIYVAYCGNITNPGSSGTIQVVVRQITLEEP